MRNKKTGLLFYFCKEHLNKCRITRKKLRHVCFGGNGKWALMS